MKYTIFGFSQQLMVKHRLITNDACVLRFIIDFYHTGKMKKTTVDDKEYVWVNYKYLSECLPILFNDRKEMTMRTKKKRISDSLGRLDNAGVIERLITKDEQGTFVYVRIMRKMYKQYISGGYQKDTGVTKINVTGGTKKTVTKDNTIKDIKKHTLSISDEIDEAENVALKKKSKRTIPPIKAKVTKSQFEKFYQAYPRKEKKGSALNAWNKLCNRPAKDRPTLKTLLKAISKQKQTKQWQETQYIALPSTWLNQNKWMDEINGMNKERNYAQNPTNAGRFDQTIYKRVAETLNREISAMQMATLDDNLDILFELYEDWSQKKSTQRELPTFEFMIKDYCSHLDRVVQDHEKQYIGAASFNPNNDKFKIYLAEKQSPPFNLYLPVSNKI